MTQELKEHLFVPHSELQGGDELTDAFTIAKSYYLKSEADKVIAELESQVHDYAQGLYVLQARAEKEARHDKYKRCLAMAKWCESEEKRLEAISPIYDTDKECWEYNSDYWGKWHDYWLELAEKFKPNNSTAQQGKG